MTPIELDVYKYLILAEIVLSGSNEPYLCGPDATSDTMSHDLLLPGSGILHIR